MLLRVDRILLRAEALPSAVAYYRDVLGLKLLRQDRQAAAFLLADGVTELILRADSDQVGEEIFYLVDSVRNLYNRREELKLKFVQPPRAVARGFRAAVKDPFGNVLQILDRTADSDAIEDAASPQALFEGIPKHTPARRELLIELYKEIGRTADDLPYTPQFEKLYQSYIAKQNPKPTHEEVWRHLLNQRKAGKLPRLGIARSESPQVAPEAEQLLRKLLGKDIGKRDRLPYSERFDKIVDGFNKSQPKPISPHLVWRLIAKLAK
jgi:hypothetical protein